MSSGGVVSGAGTQLIRTRVEGCSCGNVRRNPPVRFADGWGAPARLSGVPCTGVRCCKETATIGARVLLPLIMLPTLVGQSDPHPEAGKVTVMGRVVDSHGVPVADAMVSAYPPMAELHHGARTAADGTFVFHVDPFGAGVITASKREDGFPDPRWALYGKRPESRQPINATLAASPIQVELRLEERDAIIEWKVLSKVDGSPVRLAQFNVTWVDDTHVFFRSGASEMGILTFVLPKHPVLITISARGFRDWNSADSREFGGPVLFTPGTRDERTILLEPDK